MSTRTILLTPVDAWFFRDGRPYNQGESGQTHAHSLFPPFAPTVVGMIRASLARDRGWSGRGPWDESLHEVLGNGFHDLRQLQFSGPFLKKEEQFLFPVPQHLLGKTVAPDEKPEEQKWLPATFQRPSTNPTTCDLGDLCLPAPQLPAEEGYQFKEPAGMWITVDGYNQLLCGEVPVSASIVRSADLYCSEPRVGLARDHQTRMAEEGKLYSPQYVRLEKEVSLAVGVQGVPDDWTLPSLVTFGGESRMAYCDSRTSPLPLPTAPADAIRQSYQFTVTLLTPLFLPADDSGRHRHPLPGDVLPRLSGSWIVSACVGKPIQIGGWNSLHREPLPLRAYLPTGSTWFCKTQEDAVDAILDMHGKHIGDQTQYGLGQIALGAWPRPNGE